MKNVRTPVVVVGLLAVGWWLGSMFKGFGPGGPGTSTRTGTGDGVAVESRDPNAARTQKAMQTEQTPTIPGPAPVASGTSTPMPTPPSAGQREILTVIIDGPGYIDGTDESRFRAVELAEVVALAKATQGDDQGVHVRIRRKKNAQAGARADLIGQLQEAGLKREEIQEMSGFID
jgi:hypothetical protein